MKGKQEEGSSRNAEKFEEWKISLGNTFSLLPRNKEREKKINKLVSETSDEKLVLKKIFSISSANALLDINKKKNSFRIRYFFPAF